MPTGADLVFLIEPFGFAVDLHAHAITASSVNHAVRLPHRTSAAS
jgi:hypothetical protein